MRYGIIIRNVTDLRAEPKFRSERKSQLLYNEPVGVGISRNGYLSVTQENGYHGWADEKAVFPISKRVFCDYRKSLNYQIVSNVVRAIAPGSQTTPRFLFYGTKIQLANYRGNQCMSRSVTGETFKVASSSLAKIQPKANRMQITNAIIKRAKSFLGVPYLWGGITPFGFDCSGLVQMIYAVEAGINLPRDSKEQRKMGIKIAEEEVRIGDLRFFKGHVAIAIDKYRIIHSSLSGGGVVINSLNRNDADYRPDLVDIHIEDRRVLL
jgi:beta-lactamase class A